MSIIQRLETQIDNYYCKHGRNLPSIELSLDEWRQLQVETKDMMVADGNNKEVFGVAIGRWGNTTLNVHYPKGEKLI